MNNDMKKKIFVVAAMGVSSAASITGWMLYLSSLNEKEEVKSELVKNKNQSDELQKENERLKKENADLEKEKEEMDGELQQTKLMVLQMEDTKKWISEQTALTEVEKAILQNNFNKLEEEKHKLESKNYDLGKEVNKLKDEVEKTKKFYSDFEKKYNEQKEIHEKQLIEVANSCSTPPKGIDPLKPIAGQSSKPQRDAKTPDTISESRSAGMYN